MLTADSFPLTPLFRNVPACDNIDVVAIAVA